MMMMLQLYDAMGSLPHNLRWRMKNVINSSAALDDDVDAMRDALEWFAVRIGAALNQLIRIVGAVVVCYGDQALLVLQGSGDLAQP